MSVDKAESVEEWLEGIVCKKGEPEDRNVTQKKTVGSLYLRNK